jgi:hypothetical protein
VRSAQKRLDLFHEYSSFIAILNCSVYVTKGSSSGAACVRGLIQCSRRMYQGSARVRVNLKPRWREWRAPLLTDQFVAAVDEIIPISNAVVAVRRNKVTETPQCTSLKPQITFDVTSQLRNRRQIQGELLHVKSQEQFTGSHIENETEIATEASNSSIFTKFGDSRMQPHRREHGNDERG